MVISLILPSQELGAVPFKEFCERRMLQISKNPLKNVKKENQTNFLFIRLIHIMP
jgi:hypothetical protein